MFIKDVRNVGEKLDVSYHLRGHRSIPLLSLTSCFPWGAQASALTTQNGLNQHLMSLTDNTASGTMLLLLLLSLLKPLFNYKEDLCFSGW